MFGGLLQSLQLLLCMALLAAPALANSPFYRLQSQLTDTDEVASNYTLCSVCEELAKYIAPYADKFPVSWIETIAKPVCVAYELSSKNPDCSGLEQCTNLCDDVVDEFAPVLVPLLKNASLSPVQVCAAVDLCPQPPPAPQPGYYVPVPSNLSDFTGQRQWAAWSLTNGTGNILHLTDLHYDALYVQGSKTDCGQRLCCRAQWGAGGPNDSAGLWGDYNCDSPAMLIYSLFESLNTTYSGSNRPDFILYTGDDQPHDIWNQNQNQSIAALKFVQQQFSTYFPDVPVFMAVGNHEAVPVNEFGGPSIDSWLYSEIASIWTDFLPSDSLKTLTYGGYYEALVRPGLRIIALHTTMFSPDNAYLMDNIIDFGHQLDWMNDTLRQCYERQELAIIIGHASPVDWYPIFSITFNTIVANYSSTVLNLFFGHTHNNEVQLMAHNVNGVAVPTHTGYIGGSITSYTELNPGFTAYQYNRQSLLNTKYPPAYLVTDLYYHWINLTAANANNNVDWLSVRINARNDYQLYDLSPTSWFALAEQFKVGSKKDVFAKMQIAYAKGRTDGSGGDMKAWACAMENNNSNDESQCQKALAITSPVKRVHACSGEMMKKQLAIERANNQTMAAQALIRSLNTIASEHRHTRARPAALH